MRGDDATPSTLPGSHAAIVDPAKVRHHLLSRAHPLGRFKAVVFEALGYQQQDWKVLSDDLLSLIAREPVASSRFGPLRAASGRTVVRSKSVVG